MSTVVDASLLITAFVNRGPSGQWAKSALQRGNLAAPELILAEAANALRRSEHRRQLEQYRATMISREMTRLPVELFPFRPFAQRIWELQHNLSAYDGWYVALAETLEWPLMTLDKRLATASGPRCEVVTYGGD